MNDELRKIVRQVGKYDIADGPIGWVRGWLKRHGFIITQNRKVIDEWLKLSK